MLKEITVHLFVDSGFAVHIICMEYWSTASRYI